MSRGRRYTRPRRVHSRKFDSEDANLIQEITAGEAGEVDPELQAEHILVILRVCIDVDNKFRWWDLLRKFDGLGDRVVTRLYRTLDLHV